MREDFKSRDPGLSSLTKRRKNMLIQKRIRVISSCVLLLFVFAVPAWAADDAGGLAAERQARMDADNA